MRNLIDQSDEKKTLDEAMPEVQEALAAANNRIKELESKLAKAITPVSVTNLKVPQLLEGVGFLKPMSFPKANIPLEHLIQIKERELEELKDKRTP